ncbi:MAG: nucleotidyltransferase domain-containing protein [Deltaproteobacteria bacterium]|nr:nucleotidyltransferase domain-containing protein [Deltaproteobacteria bacterium]
MKLTKKEMRIVEEFKQRIIRRFPGEVLEVLVYGSKARGDAKEDSDIDLLVITRSEDRKLMQEIRHSGYELEIENEVILSIQVFSKDYVGYIRSIATQFIRNIDQEGIRI